MRVEEYNTVFYTHGFKHSFLCCAPSDKVPPTSGPVMSPFWGPKRGGGAEERVSFYIFAASRSECTHRQGNLDTCTQWREGEKRRSITVLVFLNILFLLQRKEAVFFRSFKKYVSPLLRFSAFSLKNLFHM